MGCFSHIRSERFGRLYSGGDHPGNRPASDVWRCRASSRDCRVLPDVFAGFWHHEADGEKADSYTPLRLIEGIWDCPFSSCFALTLVKLIAILHPEKAEAGCGPGGGERTITVVGDSVSVRLLAPGFFSVLAERRTISEVTCWRLCEFFT